MADTVAQQIRDREGSAQHLMTVARRVSTGETVEEIISQLLFGKAGRFLAGLWIATMTDELAERFCASQYASWARKTGRRPQPNIRSDLTRFKDLGMIVDIPGPGARWHARCQSPLWDVFLMADTVISETPAIAGRRFYTPSPARTETMVNDLLDIRDQTSPTPPPQRIIPAPPRRGSQAATAVRLRPRGPNGELRCSRCKEWKAETAFSLRTDRPWLYKSRCKTCMAEVARSRYLHLAKIEALNVVGLTFRVGPSDDVVGLSCVGCGEPIVVGDTVHADARLHHERCLT